MAYISASGSLQQNRSKWSLKWFTDMFWGLITFFTLFFQTLYQPALDRSSFARNSGSNRRNDDDDSSRRRMGRVRQGGKLPSMAVGGG